MTAPDSPAGRGLALTNHMAARLHNRGCTVGCSRCRARKRQASCEMDSRLGLPAMPPHGRSVAPDGWTGVVHLTVLAHASLADDQRGDGDGELKACEEG